MSNVVARELHFRWLTTALGKTDVLPGSLFMWGPRSSGKRHVLNEVLRSLEIRHQAHVWGEELLRGTRSFLETILVQLGAPEKIVCENGRMFLRSLMSLLTSKLESTDRVVVAVYHTELLYEHFDILHAFINAQDYIRHNICFVLCSTLPWESLSHSFLKEIPVFYFRQYTRGELKQILGSKQQNSIPENIHMFYVNTIVRYFFTCRDLKQLARLASSLFPEFSKSFNELNQEDQSNMVKLYRLILPKMKEGYKILNFRVTPIFPGIKGQSVQCGKSGEIATVNEMPLQSRYIMIAAYIASYNPTNSDRKFFVKERGSRKRKKENPTALASPQVFPIVRLLAILACLNKEHYIPVGSVIIRSQISSLCTGGLLARVGDDLDECKYKCLASLDLIKLISASVKFELQEYLCH